MKRWVWRWQFGVALLALLAVGGYLGISALYFRVGFPLDDAWIHQTYARNLAQYGEWSFVRGQVSAGSTSPLWSLLLAVGALFASPPYAWTFLLGALALAGLAVTGENFYRAAGGRAGRTAWVGVFLALEWHLVWAAASGMETALFALLVLLVLAEIVRPAPRWGLLGLLIGVSAWVRPEGITLLGPLLMAAAFSPQRRTALWRGLGGFLLLFGPYLLFNRVLAGSFWPNTFYAKQAEYAAQLQFPLAQRLASLAVLPLAGGGVLLLPGFVAAGVRAVRGRRWGLLAAGLWWLGTLGLYALRMPVTYQHGRYLIPSMPVFFVLGCLGTVEIFQWMRQGGRWLALLQRAWAASLAVVCVLFYLLSGFYYAQDVAIIETEMVPAAHWLAGHTAPDELIAVHDIGAVGYFSQRPLVDLAGLVSPEVIPFIRDEDRLAQYLDERQVSVLVTFPTWYRHLTDGRDVLYSSGGRYAPDLGGENMTIYRWGH